MYSYIGRTEITELIQANRKGIIIENVRAVDINEYINSLFIVLRNIGLNTSIFTQPKIRKVHSNNNPDIKHTYTILLTIRKDTEIDDVAYKSIVNTIHKIVPCKTIQEWTRSRYVRT